MPEELNKHSILLGIAERVVSFLAVFAVAFIWVGSARTKVNQKVTTLELEVAELKIEREKQGEKITHMDLDGSVATKNFITNYSKEQAQQYEMFKDLQGKVSHLETMQWRLERLERLTETPRTKEN
jgi:hypothetical protein